MDMYNKPAENLSVSLTSNTASRRPHTIRHLISKNWGLIVISGLIALAIGVGALHQGHVNSIAQPVPEVETISEMPLN